MNGKRVLVTGAAGFIGSHLVEALVAAGADVRALVHYNARNDWGNLELVPAEIRDEVDVRLGDVQDPFGVAATVAGRDVVFHLAALIGIPYSYVRPAVVRRTNVTGHAERARGRAALRRRAGGAHVDQRGLRHARSSRRSPRSTRCWASRPTAPRRSAPTSSPRATRARSRPRSSRCARSTPSARASRCARSSRRSSRRPCRAARSSSVRSTPVRDFTFVTDTARAFIAAALAPDSANGLTLNAGNGQGITIGDAGRADARDHRRRRAASRPRTPSACARPPARSSS